MTKLFNFSSPLASTIKLSCSIIWKKKYHSVPEPWTVVQIQSWRSNRQRVWLTTPDCQATWRSSTMVVSTLRKRQFSLTWKNYGISIMRLNFRSLNVAFDVSYSNADALSSDVNFGLSEDFYGCKTYMCRWSSCSLQRWILSSSSDISHLNKVKNIQQNSRTTRCRHWTVQSHLIFQTIIDTVKS